MKTGFKDPIKDKDPKRHKSPWNFKAPIYDERSSCFVEAGDDHGVGHTNPVGHHGDPKQRVDTMPFGRPKTQKTEYINRGQSYQIDITDDEEAY